MKVVFQRREGEIGVHSLVFSKQKGVFVLCVEAALPSSLLRFCIAYLESDAAPIIFRVLGL